MSEMITRGFTPDLEVRSSGDGRTVEGLCVPYGRRQRIHEGLTEQFARGAFASQVRAPNRVKFSRDHLVYGGTLIGRAVELRDDPAGLWGAFRVAATSAGDETLALVENGALDELSIGFRERQNRTLPDGTVERLRADLIEVSLVLEGAYGRKATVSAVREAASPCTCGCHDGPTRAAQAAAILGSIPLLPAP